MNFEQIIKLAYKDKSANLIPVIEKEVIHYAILSFLSKENYLDHLVFQGGTSLRLCYGSNRYSEDLDFAAGKDYNPENFRNMASDLQNYIESTLLLETKVKTPKMLLTEERDGVTVDKWQVSVVTDSYRKDIPKQKIKIEFANVNAHDVESRNIAVNYPGLECYQNILTDVESKNEILADKLLAFSMARYIRYRDIWDFAWLIQNQAKFDPTLLEKKISDYYLDKETVASHLNNRKEELKSIIYGEIIGQEMARFLPEDKLLLLENEKFKAFLLTAINDLFDKAIRHIQDEPSEYDIFQM